MLKLEAPRSPCERVTWALALGGRGPYEAIVIPFGFAQDKLVEGSAAGELNVLHLLPPEAQQVVVEEFAAVVGVHFQHGEGNTGQDARATSQAVQSSGGEQSHTQAVHPLVARSHDLLLSGF